MEKVKFSLPGGLGLHTQHDAQTHTYVLLALAGGRALTVYERVPWGMLQ